MTEPGSYACTIWFMASMYPPRPLTVSRSRFDMALMSPVATSITMALPHSALHSTRVRPSSCSRMSCMVMSMVVVRVVPLRGGSVVQKEEPRVKSTRAARPGRP